jgi:hypothetical protein
MGNIIRRKNRIIPEGYVSPNTHNKLKKKYLKIVKKLDKTIKESKYECCVCYDRTYKDKKKIRCDHDICKKCYAKINNNKCPLCRKQMTLYVDPRRYIIQTRLQNIQNITQYRRQDRRMVRRRFRQYL